MHDDLREQVARAMAAALTGGFPSKPKLIDYAAADAVIPLVLEAAAKVADRIAALEAGLRAVLPYTEAERLAEAAAVRCGATRDPINKAILRAKALLTESDPHAQP